eukprot:m.44528 g.44528  ORF g.44528 m.44528 type:complete len:345 (+) comp10111_c0_seq1:216-1250(+)
MRGIRTLLQMRCILSPHTLQNSRPLLPSQNNSSMSTSISSDLGALMFVGQGAQAVGMTKNMLSDKEVSDMYEKAEAVLGYDLKKIVLEGPDQLLSETIHAQPALLIAGLAAASKLRQTDPEVENKCIAAAGLSLGEYSALVFADAISFEDALAVVKVRAEAMQKAASTTEGTMLTVIGMEDNRLHAMCSTAANKTGEPCRISNFLFPRGRVVGGSVQAINVLKNSLASIDGVMAKPVVVSGAFHTQLMESACNPVREALEKITIREPRIPVISNTTGKPFQSTDEIKDLLVRQIVEPVLWQQSVEAMIDLGATKLYDMGPRTQLKAMVRKINPKYFRGTQSIEP